MSFKYYKVYLTIQGHYTFPLVITFKNKTVMPHKLKNLMLFVIEIGLVYLKLS